MAWSYLPGVHSAVGQITGPGSAPTDQTTNVDIKDNFNGATQRILGAPPAPINAVRTITWANDQQEYSNGFKGQTDRIKQFSNAGLFPIPCFSLHQENWGTNPPWLTRLNTFLDGIEGFASVVELGNEPKKGFDFNANGTGGYYDKLRVAAPVLRNRGFEVIAGGVPTGPDVDYIDGLDAAGGLWPLIDGVAIHPYYQNAGPLTWTSPGPGTPELGSQPNQIDWVAARRHQINRVSGTTNKDLWLTEFGWHTQNPSSDPSGYAGEGHNAGQQALKMETAFHHLSLNAEDLKIRAACWFCFQDYSTTSYVWDTVCGMRRNRKGSGFNATAPIDWKNGVLNTFAAMQTEVNPPPPPTDPPVVVTLSADTITKNSARLRGTVNPKGSATTWHFEYQQVTGVPTPTQHTLFLGTSSTSGGTGSVTGPGITAPPPDSILMDEGASKTLTAATADTFDGWTVDGADMGTASTLPITMGTSDIHVNAGFTGTAGPTNRSVTTAVSGPGSVQVRQGAVVLGTATSAATYQNTSIPDGTVLTFDYIPSASTLSSWSSIPSGVATGTTDPKDITITQNLVVTANATANVTTRTLDVNLTGDGDLHVFSCDAAGTQVAGIDTSITGGTQTGTKHLTGITDASTHHLKEVPTNANFNGWTGDGTGAGNIRTISSMDANKVVGASSTAIIVPPPPPADLYVNAASTAGGTGTTSATTGANRAFASIQAAINAAAAGKVISVAGGDYTGNINTTKSNFTLQGDGTYPRIVCTGQNRDHGIYLDGQCSNVTVDNFEIFDVQHATNLTGGVRIANNGGTNAHDITLNDLKIHKVKSSGGGTPSAAGIMLTNYGGYGVYTPTLAMRNITITDCEIYEIGAGSVDGTNEHMGIFMAGVYNYTIDGCTIYLCKKEAIRDLECLRGTVKNCHFLLNWSGGAPNYGNGSHWYNNASYFNQIGFEPKHTNFYLQGGASGANHWNGETAAAANNRNIFAHNTTFGNIGSSFDLGQGGDLFNFTTVKDNLWGDRGTVLLRDFTPIGGSVIVDHNNYNTAAGTPPAAPRARYARDFPGTAAQDSTFPFAGYGGAYETNGTGTAVTFTDPPSGAFDHSGTLTGEDLGDGYGTQVGCNGIGTAAVTWNQYTYTASTTMGGGSLAPLSDGAYDSAWTATSNLGSLTFDLGSSKTVSTIVIDTIIRQNGPGQYKAYTIETSPDNSTWTQRRAGAVQDDLRTSTKHTWTPVAARYVRFNITSMWQGGADRAEICQVRLGALTSNAITKNLVTDYGGVTQATIASAVADAKTQLAATPNITYTVHIPAGTWDLSSGGTNATIDLSNVVAGATGRFILRGAGANSTTLVLNDALIGINASNFNRITIADMTMTRPLMKVSQGTVVSVTPGQVVLRIQAGFPLPMDLHSGQSGKGAGRYLRKFTNSASDPQLVVTGNNQEEWEDASLVSGRDWAMHLNDPDVAPYGVGDLIGIKSKHGGDAYKFTTGDGVFFDSVIWLQESRGAFRHVNNVHVANSKILRAPAISGQVPCLSTPDGGPQVGQPGDLGITGALVENCTFIGTGDDGVACFNATGVVRDNYIQDAFARGINLYVTDGSPSPACTPSTCCATINNTMVRCAIEDTSYNQRT